MLRCAADTRRVPQGESFATFKICTSVPCLDFLAIAVNICLILLFGRCWLHFGRPPLPRPWSPMSPWWSRRTRRRRRARGGAASTCTACPPLSQHQGERSGFILKNANRFSSQFFIFSPCATWIAASWTERTQHRHQHRGRPGRTVRTSPLARLGMGQKTYQDTTRIPSKQSWHLTKL